MGADLKVRNLRVSYRDAQVLHGIDLDVHEGQTIVLLGANGAGKTTTLKGLCGLVPATGEIEYCGETIRQQPTENILRRGIALVPEGRGTFSTLTTEENLQLGGIARPVNDSFRADIRRMYDYFPVLEERKAQQAGMLSGGEQQMLAVARALMSRPRLLLLDEPSFGLAPLIIEQLFSLLKSIREAERISLLIVEQNAALVMDFADAAYVLEAGKIVLSGTAQQMMNNEAVLASYMGN
ncbi:ABC transporter ATP-binding protein [Bradyrhizobium manausense]